MPDLGIRLQLLLGATVPIPAPYPVVDALVSAEVENKDRDFDGFKLTFTIGRDSLLDYGLLQSGILDPPSRIIIIVIIGVLPQVLIDGIITNHQVAPSNDPGQSMLHVFGKDISLKLDLEEKRTTYPNQSDSIIVTRLLANYATLGLDPKVTRTDDHPIQIDRIPTQQGTDLAYIRQLAQQNGFVFYIEPTAPGFNTAYWGLEGLDNRLERPQPALTMNMGANTNVDAPITFSFDALAPVNPQVSIVEPLTRRSLPIPLPQGLQSPLARQPSQPLRKILPQNTAKLSLAQATLRALSSASDSANAITATGELDAVRYGGVLRSRRLVGVRGVGQNYDGNYYVQQVTHRIRRGEYKQSFTLTREGRGALTPLVRP